MGARRDEGEERFDRVETRRTAQRMGQGEDGEIDMNADEKGIRGNVDAMG